MTKAPGGKAGIDSPRPAMRASHKKTSPLGVIFYRGFTAIRHTKKRLLTKQPSDDLISSTFFFGGVAHLVERDIRIVEVVSSSLIVSTNFICKMPAKPFTHGLRGRFLFSKKPKNYAQSMVSEGSKLTGSSAAGGGNCASNHAAKAIIAALSPV